MSVLIRGMEMPKSCWECEVGSASQLDNKTCPFYAMDGQEQENYQYKIAEGCPLSYVPPHGRLIDADNFIDRVKADVGMVEEDLSFEFKDGIWSVLKLLETQPTVIEAEK